MKLKLKNYRVIKKIGHGGMGLVYVAEDLALGRLVALKVLAPYLVQDPEILERFRFEARNQAQLVHPNITMVHSFLVEDEQAFLVLEFIDGETLESRINREGRIVAMEALPIFRKILGALGYAHSKGVIHRDIKPGNIAFTSEGNVKIMDFGIALNIEETGRLTKTGHVLGTPHYMAPEQILGKELTFRTDIYALGITLFEMLTGRLPFDSKSDYEVRVAQINHPPPSPRSFGYQDITPELEEVILKALAKEPEARFSSTREFLQALEAAVGRDHLVTLVKDLRLDKSTQVLKVPRKPTPPPPEPEREEPPAPPPEPQIEAPPEPPPAAPQIEEFPAAPLAEVQEVPASPPPEPLEELPVAPLSELVPEEPAAPPLEAPAAPPMEEAAPPISEVQELSVSPAPDAHQIEESPSAHFAELQELAVSPPPEHIAELEVAPLSDLPQEEPEETAAPPFEAPMEEPQAPPFAAQMEEFEPPSAAPQMGEAAPVLAESQESSVSPPSEPIEELPLAPLSDLPQEEPEETAAPPFEAPMEEPSLPQPPEVEREEPASPALFEPVAVPVVPPPSELQVEEKMASAPAYWEQPRELEAKPVSDEPFVPPEAQTRRPSRARLIFLPLALLPLLALFFFFRTYFLPGPPSPPKTMVSSQPSVTASKKETPSPPSRETKAPVAAVPAAITPVTPVPKESAPAEMDKLVKDQPEKEKPITMAALPPPPNLAESPAKVEPPKPVDLQKTIKERLAANGFPNLGVQVDEKKGVVISGNVKNMVQKNKVIQLVNSMGLLVPLNYGNLKVERAEVVEKVKKKVQEERPRIARPEAPHRPSPPSATRKPLPPRIDRGNIQF